ncbi:MAG: hypothetical protein AAB472_01710 [Patescibacteria group bacterium]
MSIVHVYEPIQEIEVREGDRFITLDDHTRIGFRVDEFPETRNFRVGDMVLIDFQQWNAARGKAHVRVFRDHDILFTSRIGGKCYLECPLLA